MKTELGKTGGGGGDGTDLREQEPRTDRSRDTQSAKDESGGGSGLQHGKPHTQTR